MGAAAVGIGIQDTYFHIVAKGVLQEHAAQLAAAEQRDHGPFPPKYRIHAPKLSGAVAPGLSVAYQGAA